MPYSSMNSADPPGAGEPGSDEGMHVAQHLVGAPDVLGEESEEVLVGLAGAKELHGWDLEPFLVDLAGVEAVLGAPDVRDVSHHPAERDHPTVPKHRDRDGDVEQMAGAEPRIVRDEHVTRLQGFRADSARSSR